MNRSLPNVAAVLVVITVGLVLFGARLTSGASRAVSGPVAAPIIDATASSPAEDTAVFAGGCFWGIEAVFEHVKGVKSAISGYAGGNVSNPSYEQVSTGDTGHSAAKTFSRPIVTQVTKLNAFYPAEAYHQDYLAHHPNQLYIVINDQPKVAALKKQFPDIYRN